MQRSGHTLTVAALLLLHSGLPLAQTELTLTTHTVAVDDGSTLIVEQGSLPVPERHRQPDSRRIAIPFYRLRSQAKQPAAPIFLLAGGPGASALARSSDGEFAGQLRFYQQLADVVVFDQRGSPRSEPDLDCPQRDDMALSEPLDADTLARRMGSLLQQCARHWQQQGVDLTAYNSDENSRDVDALRQALGYDRITLIGGSYGSHLALQLLRQYPRRIARAVLFGVEGPDHTWDDPAGRLAVLQRIADDAERAGLAKPGELMATLARVIAALEQQPQQQQVTVDGQPHSVRIDAFLVRWIAGRRAGQRQAIQAWPEMILAMGRGDFAVAAQAAIGLRRIRLDRPMHYAMDCASGISAARRQRYARDPATALLGAINFEYEALCRYWPHQDLGETFRAPVRASIPTLILHGDWDTATPIENAREVAADLPQARLVEVRYGSHGALSNLFAHWPPFREKLAAFLRAEASVWPEQIALSAPRYPDAIAPSAAGRRETTANPIAKEITP